MSPWAPNAPNATDDAADNVPMSQNGEFMVVWKRPMLIRRVDGAGSKKATELRGLLD